MEVNCIITLPIVERGVCWPYPIVVITFEYHHHRRRRHHHHHHHHRRHSRHDHRHHSLILFRSGWDKIPSFIAKTNLIAPLKMIFLLKKIIVLHPDCTVLVSHLLPREIKLIFGEPAHEC